VIETIKGAVTPAAASIGSAALSFFANTLPTVQWISAAVAIVSGLFAITWVGIQIHDRLRGRRRP
jgi:hypothetical protein